MITFPNYVLKHLAQSQQHNIITALRTLSTDFDPAIVNNEETLKFLTDSKKFDTTQFAIINLHGAQYSVISTAIKAQKSSLGKFKSNFDIYNYFYDVILTFLSCRSYFRHNYRQLLQRWSSCENQNEQSSIQTP